MLLVYSFASEADIAPLVIKQGRTIRRVRRNDFANENRVRSYARLINYRALNVRICSINDRTSRLSQ